MLAETQMKSLTELVQQYTKEELVWVSGYLAGLAKQNGNSNGHANGHTNGNAVNGNATVTPIISKTITLLYGTETGNSKRAATAAAGIIKKQGLRVKLASLDQYKIQDLHKEENLLVIISTQGDGEPPAAAQKFYDYLHSTKDTLPNTAFTVLALGSYAYPNFCKTGIDVDAQLVRMGAKQLLPVITCDEDFEMDAALWLSNSLKLFSEHNNVSTVAETAPAPAVVIPAKAVEKGKKYFTATMAANINLNDEGSEKATHHIELSLGEELEYKPGDAIGLVPENSEELVQKIIGTAGITGQEELTYKTENYTVYNLLKKKVNLRNLSERLVKKYAALVQQEIPEMRIDFADLLKIYPPKDTAQLLETLTLLDAMAPRIYSIVSSPLAHPGELHLTVARDRFEKNDGFEYGLGSYYLQQLAVDATVSIFLHKQKHFHLPPDDKDLIMIGPGIGLAPLRSFIFERDALGATGRNWLFFGEQHFTTDFYYQTEIQGFQETGVLQKVSLAFSRDQKEKIYVQHRMQEQAAELWDWINSGAYIAVCGTKDPISKDIEKALIDIIAEQNDLTTEAATGYLHQLSKDGRYVKDVW